MILKQSIDSIAKLKVSFSTWSIHETLSKQDPEVLRYGEDCVVVSPDSVREAGRLRREATTVISAEPRYNDRLSTSQSNA